MEAARDPDGPGARFAPEFLLTAILAPATAWSAANPFGPRLSAELAADLLHRAQLFPGGHSRRGDHRRHVHVF